MVFVVGNVLFRINFLKIYFKNHKYQFVMSCEKWYSAKFDVFLDHDFERIYQFVKVAKCASTLQIKNLKK